MSVPVLLLLIVRDAVLELTYTANDMAPFAHNSGYVEREEIAAHGRRPGCQNQIVIYFQANLVLFLHAVIRAAAMHGRALQSVLSHIVVC